MRPAISCTFVCGGEAGWLLVRGPHSLREAPSTPPSLVSSRERKRHLPPHHHWFLLPERGTFHPTITGFFFQREAPSTPPSLVSSSRERHLPPHHHWFLLPERGTFHPTITGFFFQREVPSTPPSLVSSSRERYLPPHHHWFLLPERERGTFHPTITGFFFQREVPCTPHQDVVHSRVCRMDVDSSQLNESALKLALEIMFLLTGEVYIIIKKLGNGAASGNIPHVAEGWSLAQNTLVVPSHYPEKEKSNDENILELTKNIIALLTREVPMRSQDVTVYFSMDEWEYLEEHDDFYRDIMMDNQQTLTSAGGSRNCFGEIGWRNAEPEAHPGVPHSCQTAQRKNHNGSQVVLMDGVMKRIKVEGEDSYHIGYHHTYKEEIIPKAICPEASGTRNTSDGCPVNPYLTCKTEADTDFIQKVPLRHQHPLTPKSVFRDLLMYKDRRNINKRILDLTMEIIYLLSRGDYVILKSSGEHVIPSGAIHSLAGQNSTHSPLMLPSSDPLTYELHNEQKILEVTNKLNELLTGEVPLRCHDVTVYFSVEEWEYFEQHKDLYMKRFASPSNRTNQGYLKRDTAPCRNSSQNAPYSQPNTVQGDTDFSDSEETVSDSEDYEDDESQSDTESEDEVPLSKINDPDLQVLLNRLRKMVKESEDYNPLCFQNDPEWGPGF
ncbi:uncharacterized protein ACNLHF_019846 isoform 4-T4 [Anomaloglossus baeobatrachus]|uniref:uncharacterized protein LOC142311146 isoform X2 n=2 Tax=Anomaloglossus baeobatrachus TaxID=238106 RepID=UPI003F507D86